jgi:hypothetical protein
MGVVARPDRATVIVHGVKGTGATMGGVAIGAVVMAAPAGVGEGGGCTSSANTGWLVGVHVNY